MKIQTSLLAVLLVLPNVTGFSQSPPEPPRQIPTRSLVTLGGVPPHASSAEPGLTKFSLDFPGGTPKQLVAAIEKAMGRSLNVIIAEEHANAKLPSLKMTDVNVPQLFAALLKISFKYDNNRSVVSSFGFETEAGQPTEDSIWRFFVFNPAQPSPTTLTRFDLDFPGGTPKQLAAAIEKATRKPLNVVIPAEHADLLLPPLKMTDVNVAVLFQALTSASRKTVAYSTGSYGPGNSSYQQMVTAYGFKTEGAITDTSIWSFYVEKPNLPPVVSTGKVCRFYSLVPYLERGTTVDDITTAIQTGWKMLGDKDTPNINFHKDTKLLIAVGEPAKLETIDAVLQALQPPPENFASRMNSIIQKANAATPPSPLPPVPLTPPAIPKPGEPPKPKL